MYGSTRWGVSESVCYAILLYTLWMNSTCCADRRRNTNPTNQVYAGIIRINKTHGLSDPSSSDYFRSREDMLVQITAILNETAYKNVYDVNPTVNFRPGLCQFEIAIFNGQPNYLLPYNLTKIFKEGFRRMYGSSTRWSVKAIDVWFIDSKDGLQSGLPQPNDHIGTQTSTCTALSFPPCMSLDYDSSLDLEWFSPKRSPTKLLGLSNFRFHWDILARNCSPLALDFVCSVSHPRCHDNNFVFPCRRFCKEIYSLCNFAHTCDEFIDDDDPSICYMPRQLSEETFPKVVPASCDEDHFLCDNLECIDSMKRCDGVVDCSDGSDETQCRIVPVNPLRCDFESSSWCGLVPSFDTNFLWRLVRAGSVVVGRGSNGNLEVLRDHTLGSTAGWVAMADASGRVPYEVARMVMRPYVSIFSYCLHFYYIVPDEGSSQLNVYLTYSNGSPSFARPVKVWHKNGWSPHWRSGQVDLQPGKVKVIFEIIRGLSYHGDVILDDISIIIGKCPLLNCSSTEFLCKSTKKCIGLERTCDKVNDCGDNSDESECSCSLDEFQCISGGCIAGWRRCNDEVDCFDGSDEEQCECPMGQVNCYGKCIMKEWVCDGEKDVEGGEDESNCSSCKGDEFECSSHDCIPLEGRCDGKMECSDGSDEVGCLRLSESSAVEVLRGDAWVPVCAQHVGEDECNELCRRLGMRNAITVGAHHHHGDNYVHLERYQEDVLLYTMRPTCLHHHVLTLTCKPQTCASSPTSFSNPVENRVEGRPMGLESWPWMVELYNGRSRKCGATLIDSLHLLTAAHCFDVATDLRMYYVARGRQSRSIEGVFVHPSYSKTSYWFNDLAVIRLKEPMTSFVPVCLRDLSLGGEFSSHTSLCYSSRWIYDHVTDSFYLNQTKLKIWKHEKCKKSYPFLTVNNFCAGYESGLGGLCQGDSGNALLCRTSASEPWTMVGMFSFFYDNCRVPMKPSGFLNISKYVPWIHSITRCPFWCEGGRRCLWAASSLCNGVEDCLDGFDEDDEFCGRNVTCNFENPRLCGYEHVTHPSYGRWFGTRMLQEPLSTNWGPLFDHTFGNSSGHFLLGGSKPAIILSPSFTVEDRSCLQFYYLFRGRTSEEKFLVYLHDASRVDRKSISFHNYSLETFVTSQSTLKWEPVKMDIPKGRYFVEFRIKRDANGFENDLHGYGYMNEDYVGLDDVSLFAGECHKEVCSTGKMKCENRRTYSCEDKQRRCNVVYDCDGPSDEKNCTDSNFLCTMENIRDCNFVQPGPEMDQLDWAILPVRMTHMHESGGPLHDHTFRSTAGHVAYFSTIGLNAWMKAYLDIPVFLSESSGTSGCLRFHLSMISTSSLTVFMSVRRSFTLRVVSFERLQQQEWVEIEIPINYQIESITFQAEILERPHRGPGYIALDDVSIRRGQCKNKVIPPLACHKTGGGSEYMFKCRDGSGCISDNLVCDMHDNCRDGSDEMNCDHFKCFGGGGNLSMICDGRPDCFFGDDESKCGPCPSDTHFQCTSGNVSCIPVGKRCDNVVDCADGSDEDHCVIQNQEGILQGFRGLDFHPFCSNLWNNSWNEEACREVNGGSSFESISVFEVLDESLHFFLPVDASSDRFDLSNFDLSRDCPSGRVVHLACMPHECGLPTALSLQDPITIGGQISQPGQWPFVVSILRRSTHLCTGVLIHESWVLTAARCFTRSSSSHHMTSPYLMPEIHYVRAGSILKEGTDPLAQVIKVKRIHIDAYFDHVYFYPDIALVELELPLATSDVVGPACLPASPLGPLQDCYLVGWNILNTTDDDAKLDHLMFANVDPTLRGECPHPEFFYQGQICLGNSPDVLDRCHSESGGPLMCRSSSGRWSVIGVVGSRNTFQPCSSNPPWSVYTVVQNFMDWIPLVMMSSH